MNSTTKRQLKIAVGLCCCFLGFPPAACAEEHIVAIRDYRFVPDTLHIKLGDTVRWINMEKRSSHSLRFGGDTPVESERLFPGEVWSRRFDLAGIIEYSCGPHPEMTAQIKVTE